MADGAQGEAGRRLETRDPPDLGVDSHTGRSGRGRIEADGGQRAVAAAPQALSCMGGDEGFGRGSVLIPVCLVLRADLPHVDGEGRIPSRYIPFFLQPWIFRRQGRVNGQAAHLHNPLEAEVGLLGPEFMARADYVIGQGDRITRELRPALGLSKRRGRGRRRRGVARAVRLRGRGR